MVRQLGVDAELITADANFRETLGADSLELVELVMAVARHLELRDVNDEEMRQIETVGELVAYLEGHNGSGPI